MREKCLGKGPRQASPLDVFPQKDGLREPCLHGGGLDPARFHGVGRACGSVERHTGEIEILAQQWVADETGPVAPYGACFGELGDGARFRGVRSIRSRSMRS